MAEYDEHVRAFLAEIGLTDRLEALASFFAPTVLIREAGAENAVNVGVTKMGGGPDLPEGVDWPREPAGFHYNFLAQVNLADMPLHDARIPREGLLSIFCDADQSTGPVLFAPRSALLRRHAMSDAVERDTEIAHDMVVWSSDAQRLVLCAGASDTRDGVTATTGADGRIEFLRDGKPIIALADQYAVTPCARAGVMSVGFAIDQSRQDDLAAAGLDPDGPALDAYHARFDGAGPVHCMFGHPFTQGGPDWTPQGRAIRHAAERGWSDLLDPASWFVLCELVSGGEVDFNFGDFGSYVVVANSHDTLRGDFSRCYGFVESS